MICDVIYYCNINMLCIAMRSEQDKQKNISDIEGSTEKDNNIAVINDVPKTNDGVDNEDVQSGVDDNNLEVPLVDYKTLIKVRICRCYCVFQTDYDYYFALWLLIMMVMMTMIMVMKMIVVMI